MTQLMKSPFSKDDKGMSEGFTGSDEEEILAFEDVERGET